MREEHGSHDPPLAHPQTSLVKTSVREYAERCLVARKGEIAATTFAKYRTNWKELCAFLAERADWEIGRITPRMIAEFRDHLAQTVAASTVNHKLKTIRVLFRQAWKDSLITESPAEKVPMPRSARSARREFSVDEVKALLRHADEEWKGMILCGVYTGQRLGDITALTWGNVDLEEKPFSIGANLHLVPAAGSDSSRTA